MNTKDSSRRIAQSICNDLIDDRTNCTLHIVNGSQGVGKTRLSKFILSLPQCKDYFCDGVVWIGLGSCNPLSYQEITSLYQRIYSTIHPTSSDKIDFGTSFYYPGVSDGRAILNARETMSELLLHKKVLICLDGIRHLEDIQYFQFENKEIDMDLTSSFRLLVTTKSIIHENIFENNKYKLWDVRSLASEESRKLLLTELGDYKDDEDFISDYGDAYLSCHGNPLVIRALGRMMYDQYSNSKSISKIVGTIEHMNLEGKLFSILETTLTHISLGRSYSKVTWRCFGAFTMMFSREDCVRPWIPIAPVISLFKIVIAQVSKSQVDSVIVSQTTHKIMDWLVDVGMLNKVMGTDPHEKAQIFYQVHNDIYQGFGEKLGKSPKVRPTLHRLLVEDYVSGNMGQEAESSGMDSYMSKWLPFHLMEAKKYAEAVHVLQDLNFIEMRLKNMGIDIGTKKHIHDVEQVLKGNKTLQFDKEKNFLNSSYTSFLTILERDYSDKENCSTYDADTLYQATWDLVCSLFLHGHLKDGYELLKRFHEVDVEFTENYLEFQFITLQHFTEVDPNDEMNVARIMIKVGSILSTNSKKVQDGIKILQVGFEKLEKAQGEESLEAGRARIFVGEVLYDLRLYDDALELFKGALPILLKELGEFHEEIYDALTLTGKAYYYMRNLDQALKIFKCVLPKVEGPLAVNVGLKVGEILIQKGKHKKAMSVLKRIRKETSDTIVLSRINILLNEATEHLQVVNQEEDQPFDEEPSIKGTSPRNRDSSRI